MVVHSYDPTVDIVKDFDRGTKEILEAEIEPLVQTYYMNVLNKTTIKQKVNAGIEARMAIDRFKPKILIAVGDEAQEFAAKFYLGQKNLRVIFAEVKGDFKNFGYKLGENVAGIVEVPQIQELNILINQMFPEKKNIRLVHLGDTSTITNLTEKSLREFSWKNVKLQDSVRVADAINFKKAAKLLSNNCDVLLISSYKGLKNNFEDEDEVMSDEIMKWVVENTSIPVVSTIGYAVEEGAGAAIVSSSYDQGMLAMSEALTMLNRSAYLPNLTSKIFAVFLNDSHINKRKIRLPDIYRSFAVGTQKLYQQSKVQGADR
jgi:ABC-type uncharacterized transport system substrate-binding protein